MRREERGENNQDGEDREELRNLNEKLQDVGDGGTMWGMRRAAGWGKKG